MADDRAKLSFAFPSSNTSYPALPIARGLMLSDGMHSANLTFNPVEGVALEWSVKQPERGVRLRIYHAEPSVLAALQLWGVYHGITDTEVSYMAAQLARAAPRAQMIWASPPYEPFARTEPLLLSPESLAIKALVTTGGGGGNAALLGLLKPMMTPAAYLSLIHI